MSDLIRTTAELEAACAAARVEGILSLDTEFVWKATYRPQLGIVQLGTRTACWAVDCRTAIDTTALKAVIEDEDVTKILHDARQDLMHLYHWTGAVPANVFDTQLAAAFAGFPAGMGLQKLLVETLGIELPKTETLTDWLQRPLTPQQVAYALDDVRYLPALKDELVRRASEFGTLDWLFEELTKYDGADLYDETDVSDVWKKIRLGRTRLAPRDRAVLQAVAACRETLAREMNLPRNWLGDDGSLVRMALEHRVVRLVHRLKGGRIDTVSAQYAAAIRTALETPEEDCPPDPKPYYIEEVRAAADAAHVALEAKAAECHVDPTVVANRATLIGFIDDPGDESNPLAVGWRQAAFGAELAEKFALDE